MMNEFIDLGLSVNWATCNIGANYVEEHGLYFQWGSTVPYNVERISIRSEEQIHFNWKN